MVSADSSAVADASVFHQLLSMETLTDARGHQCRRPEEVARERTATLQKWDNLAEAWPRYAHFHISAAADVLKLALVRKGH